MQDNHSHPLPTPSSTDTAISSTVRPAKLYLRLEDLFPPLSFPARRLLAVGAGILAVTVAVGVFLWQRAEANAPPPAGDGSSLGGSSAQTQDSAEGTTYEDTATDRGDPTDTPPSAEPTESEPAESGTSVESDPVESPTSESITEETSPPDEGVSDTEEVTEDTDETAPLIPEGCVGFAAVDVSESILGVDHITTGGLTLPAVPSVDTLWDEGTPAVLIVNTQPYEGYGGGAAWYDPSAGGLALTETANDPDGVVALGTALAHDLRERGITVIHLRIPVSAEDASADIFARTEAAIRDYCRLYPNIGLVLDLRRTAELTTDGSILATQGSLDGSPCAQVRVSVSGGRKGAISDLDLALAQSLRESLWAIEPTLTRPTRVKSGEGLAGDLPDLRVLTLEVGSAGNTYVEACVTLKPLGKAVAEILQKYS